MTVTQSRKAKKYGEKDARLKEFRQKHQPPVALKRAVGNDEELMALCPSYGQENLGDQAEPLSPESKDDYVRRKAREKEAKAQAIQSKQSQARGPSKKTVKRKPYSTVNRTFPPDLPGPIMTVFSATPPPPVLQPSTTHWQGAVPRNTHGHSPSLPWHALSYSMPPGSLDSRPFTIPASMSPDTIYQPSATEVCNQYAHNAAYSRFHAPPPALHTTVLTLSHGTYVVDNVSTASPVTTPSLESYRGSPSTDQSPPPPPLWAWAESPAPSMTPPFSYTAAQPSAAQGGARSEDRFHIVYQQSFVRRSSGGHESHIPVLGEEHANAPPVDPNAAHCKSWNTVASIPNRLLHPVPSPPTVMSSPDFCMRDSTSVETGRTAIWTSTPYQGRYLEQATPASGALSDYQWREPTGRAPSSIIGAPRVDGPACATPTSFDRQLNQGPCPSHSIGSSAGHAGLDQSLATVELSAGARYAHDVVAPPLAAAASHQVQQHDVSAIQAHIPPNNGHHVSTRTPSLHAHTGHIGAPPIIYTTSAPLVNQHSLGAPTTTDAQQHTHSTPTSISTYSELAHALVDHYAGTPSATQASAGQGAVHTPLYMPQIRGGTIGSPSNGPGALVSQVESADDEMTRIFEGCFDDCEPLPSPIMSLLLGADFATGQSSDLDQQLLTTSMWPEAQD